MEFLGVGPTELLLIIVLALIVLGPKDLAKTGKTIGKWLNDIVRSDTWKAVQKTSKELRQLPTQLMRQDNLERFLTDDPQKSAPRTNAGTWAGKIGTGMPVPAAKPDLAIPSPTPVEDSLAPAPAPAQKRPAAAPRKKAASSKTTVSKTNNKTVSRKKSDA